MSNIKVRVGQQNAIRVTSSISGGTAFADNATNSTNVIGGIASVTQLSVSGVSTFSGISTFKNDVYIDSNLTLNTFTANSGNITGILTVGQFLYYSPGQPYGIAYFDSNDRLTSTGSTSASISQSNYVLTTNNLGVPSWTDTIDGGEY